jgi:hypothetical protein
MTSTSTQDRVRRAIAATAEQIAPGTVPPLRLEQAGAGRRHRTSSRRWPVWLAPAAAAASVAVIATATLIVSNGVVSHPQLVGPVDVPVPPYYIALTKAGDDAAIYATRTGALIARVVPPESTRPVLGLSAAADDRTFAIAVPAGAHWNSGQPPKRFYLVTFDPATRTVTTSLVPGLAVPRNATIRAFALSPSATKLAVAYQVPNTREITDDLKVMDLRTGSIRTWTSPHGEVLYGPSPIDLSWSADNKTLALNWYSLRPAGQQAPSASGLWLLDTAKPGGGLFADSRRVLSYRVVGSAIAIPGNGYLATLPVLTPDGRTAVVALTSTLSDTSGYTWFAVYDAANGRLERTFGRTPLTSARPAYPQMSMLWTSPPGDVMVIGSPPGQNGQIGVVRKSGRLTLLPTSPDVTLIPGPAW